MKPPLSADQAALWFADEQAADGPRPHIAYAVEITGPLDVEVFRRCCRRLVERHAALRVRISADDGVPYQVIVAEPMLDLRHERVAGHTTAEVWAALLAEAGRPFNLQEAPPFRLRIYSFTLDRHWLLWSMHPIVADARSRAVLVAEFARLYSAAGEGRVAVLEPVGRGYADALAEQEEWRHGPEAQRLRGQIIDLLRPEPPRHHLATDLSEPAHRRAEGAEVIRAVSPALAADVQTFCAERGVASSVLLNTVYQTLLHLRTGQDRILVGVSASSRPGPVTDRLVGCFATTVPVVLDLSGDPSFDELLAQAREATAAAVAGRRVPLVDVAARLGGRPGQPRTPLVQAAFTHLTVRPDDPLSTAVPFVLGAPDAELRVGDVTLRPLPPVRSITPFEWELIAAEEPGRLTLSLRFDDGMFRPAAARSLLDHLVELLDQVVAEPRLPISALPPATGAETAELDAWNRTDRDYSGLPWVHEAFRQQAAESPDAVALRCGARSVTYRELARRVDAVARSLREHGVGPGSVVGVAVERSVELVESLYGILAAGAAYLPLDPDYPRERLSFMIEDSGAALVVCQPHLKERLPNIPVPVLWAEDGEPPATGLDRVEARVRPGTTAYVIYTSGSTGRPKGTLITHAALRNRIAWMQEQYGLTPDDRVLQKTPSSFDVSVWEFFWPLTQGACLVLARPGGQRDMAYLADVISAEEVTTLHFVPSVLRLFLAEPTVDRCTSLRRMFCSGEALPPDLATAVLDRLPCELHNLYGPTEATVDVTWWPCRSGDDVVPIGHPVANTAIHVLDRAGRRLPPGVPGEIHIGGVQLASGYLNRPRLTAERFVPDPFSAMPGARLYRTGDLGRYRPDGAVEFLGRLDHQLKLHGNRVEIGEIEACLSAHPEVRAAVVTVTRHGGAAALEGHVVPVNGARPDPARLASHLREHLPPFMIPGRIRLLDRLPLTPSGKADRSALQDGSPAGTAPATGRRPARSAVERLVARAVADVLDRSGAAADDDFFALGGVSADVLRLRARLARAGLDVPVRDILRHPTIEGIARATRVQAGQAGPPPVPFALLTTADRALLPPDVEDAFPVTGSLGELVRSATSGRPPRRRVLTLTFTGEFSESAMLGALDVLAARHDILRSSFAADGPSVPLQLVRRHAALPLRVHRVITPLSAEDTAVVVAEVRQARVDVVRGALVRIEVVAGLDAFTVVLGHPDFDHWSLALLTVDLMAAYVALAGGREPVRPAYPPSSGAWLAALERLSAAADAGHGPTAHDRCPLPAPTGADGRSGAPGAGAPLPVPLTAEVRAGLADLADRTGASVSTVFLAAHLTVLGALTGRTTATTGVVTDCRPRHVTAERYAGAFTRVLSLQVDLTAATWEDLVREVARVEHQVRARHAVEPVACDTAFDDGYVDLPDLLGALPGLRLRRWSSSAGSRSRPLTAQLRHNAAGEPVLVLDVDEETVNAPRVAEGYARVLAAMAAGPGAACDIDVRTDRERAVAKALSTIEAPWTSTGPTGAYRRVAQVAARLPQATAVRCGGRDLTYADLDAGAEILASRLRAAGTPPGGVVAVSTEASADLPVALLGVLRAGAAYLPLAPDLPADRVRRLLTDAGVCAVVGLDGTRSPTTGTGLPTVVAPPAYGVSAAVAPGPHPQLAPEAVACVVPGAGRDAAPAVVSVSHAALDDAVHAVRHRLNWQDEDEVLLVVPSPQWPLVGPEVLLALTTGARLLLASAEQARDPYALDELLLAGDVTTVLAAPDTWEALLNDGWPGDPALRLVCVGPVSPPLRASLGRAGRVAWSLYGQPETGLWSLASRIDGHGHEPLLGHPLPHATCHVVGADGRPLPFGVPGELHIGGRGLSHGYRGRPDLDAHSFVMLPGVVGPVYRTGERVRLRSDGMIEAVCPDNPEGAVL